MIVLLGKLFVGAVLLALLAVACGPPPARTTSLRLEGTPPNARVTVDDIYVGTLDVVATRGVALPPGQHRISVEAPGYFPDDRLVQATGAGPVRLTVRLEPVPE